MMMMTNDDGDNWTWLKSTIAVDQDCNRRFRVIIFSVGMTIMVMKNIV